MRDREMTDQEYLRGMIVENPLNVPEIYKHNERLADIAERLDRVLRIVPNDPPRLIINHTCSAYEAENGNLTESVARHFDDDDEIALYRGHPEDEIRRLHGVIGKSNEYSLELYTELNELKNQTHTTEKK